MGIGKVVRTISEKTTSVEDPIELTQKGIITFVPTSKRIIAIPTTIQNPVFVDLMPMSEITSNALGGSKAEGWYCDLTLYKASDVSTAFGSIASNVLQSEVGRRVRMSGAVDAFHIYIAAASQTSNYGASKHSRLASTAYWKKDERFGSNAQKFLKIVPANSASANFKAKKQTLAYVVTGYNYN